MKGKRIDWKPGGHDSPFPLLQPGEYGKDEGGRWVCCTPNGMPGNLSLHLVEEHPDGSITVWPSIQTTGFDDSQARQEYHGFLTEGEWRECQ